MILFARRTCTSGDRSNAFQIYPLLCFHIILSNCKRSTQIIQIVIAIFRLVDLRIAKRLYLCTRCIQVIFVNARITVAVGFFKRCCIAEFHHIIIRRITSCIGSPAVDTVGIYDLHRRFIRNSEGENCGNRFGYRCGDNFKRTLIII